TRNHKERAPHAANAMTKSPRPGSPPLTKGRGRGWGSPHRKERTMNIDLGGRVAIVTGAGRGIGREIATTFAREGVTTIVTDIRQDNLDDVGREFAANGWQGAQHPCDVRDYAAIQRVVAATVEQFGRIDILVNNAGVAGGAPVEELAEEVWDLNQDINLKGVFL